MLGTPMLTDAQIRKAKAADKPYKLADGAGLHVYVTPAGGKLWRLRYEFERKEKLLSIGPYPSVGVAEAREAVANAKRLLREGKDPAVEKRLRRLQIVTDGGTTFEPIAREWHGMNKGHWVEQHAYDVLHSLERDVFPDLGSIPIKSITAANVLSALRMIENRPAAETARRIRQRISAVFVYAIASGRAENDPARGAEGNEARQEGATAGHHRSRAGPRSRASCRRDPGITGQTIYWRRKWDSNPRYGFPHTRFPSVRLKPLGHLSGAPSLQGGAGGGSPGCHQVSAPFRLLPPPLREQRPNMRAVR
jgi:hypothetical protein